MVQIHVSNLERHKLVDAIVAEANFKNQEIATFQHQS